MKNIRRVMKYLLGGLLLVISVGVFMGFSNSPDSIDKDSDDEIIRIELNGKYFDIPMHYMYGQAIEKYGKWPKAKKERLKVDALTLSVLLPDLRPYYPEDDARWKVKGHGERVEVSIMKFRGPPENWGRRNEINIKLIEKFISEGRFYKKSMDDYDLVHFTDANKQPYDNGDTYFANDREMKIDCNAISPPSSDWKGFYSPSCKVATDYRPGIVLEYYYGLEHLPGWREIDDGLKAMFNQFAQAAQSEPKSSTKGE